MPGDGGIEEPAMPRLPTRWRETLLVFLTALVYFLLFHRYGSFFQDEGVLAYQALRVRSGQLPYADFQTAYTPAGYYLHALLFSVFGTNLVVPRAAASVACAITATLLYVATGRVLAGPYRFLPSLLYVLLEDQASRGLVVHTLPYPARYITTLWALSLCLTIMHARQPRRLTPVLLGVVTAAIAAFKHTAGIYNAWAVGLALILIGLARVQPPATHATRSAAGFQETTTPWLRLRAVLPPGFLILVLLGLAGLFAGFGPIDWMALMAFCVPLAALALVLLRRLWEHGTSNGAKIGADLLRFGAAAVLPTVAWVTLIGWRVGFDVLAQRLLFDGAAVAHSYAISFPVPGTLARVVMALVAMMLGIRALLSLGVLGGRDGTRALAVTCGVLGIAGCVWVARLPWSLLGWSDWLLPVNHAGRQIDNVGYYAGIIVAYAFLWRLGTARGEGRPADAIVICWTHGLCQLLLAYPRLDVAHMYEGIVILLIPGAFLLQRTVLFFRRVAAPARTRWLSAGVAGVMVLVCATKIAPRIDAQLTLRDGVRLRHRTSMGEPRGGLYGTEDQDAGWISSLEHTVAFITAHTAPGTPIFAFPALSGLYFLSGRHNPSPMDYFHQGFGEGSDEIDVIAALEKTETPLIVLMTDFSFDPSYRGYFPMLKDYIRRHYVQSIYFAPFRVLERMGGGRPRNERDRDADGIPDIFDNCVTAANPYQENSDGDRLGDACDNCPYVQNNDQADRNGDGVGNRCSIDITGDDFTDGADISAFAVAAGGTYDPACDFDDDGQVDVLDLALFALPVRIGIGTEELWDFTFAFVDHSVAGGTALSVPQGMVISAVPGSDLIVFPGRGALLVRSGTTGDPASEGVLTSRPFVPRGPRLTLNTVSESPDLVGVIRVLRPTRTPSKPPPHDVLVEVPLRNDRPSTGPSARFLSQTVDLSPWFNAEAPLRSTRIQVQVRQHTTRRGSGFFTLVGDLRTGP